MSQRRRAGHDASVDGAGEASSESEAGRFSGEQTRDTKYASFLDRKGHIGGGDGFAPTFMPSQAFDFQASLVEWACSRGSAALFEDCGLGKSLQELAWAENVVRRTNRPVLLLTPLAVARQFVREGEKFGVDVARSTDGHVAPGARVVVANYERLHHFDPHAFAGVVCDESSVLKSFNGRRRQDVTRFARRVPYRLLATATAAPNDHVELGTSSEALGGLGHMDMLGRYFKNDTGTLHIHGSKIGEFHRAKWRFKAHAETHFWRWVCSWARACRRPSDLGFNDGDYRLPPLVTHETVVKASRAAPGMLFEVAAENLQEQREEQRRTLDERCEAAARLLGDAGSAVAWCQLNDEGDRLAAMIPGAVQVSGSDADEAKEEAFEAFAANQIRVLVSKPTIAGFGLNWQHCARMTFFPSHSFEQFYQAVRRCWRFGQQRAVTVDVVTTEGGRGVLENLNRKARQAEHMFDRLVALMNEAAGPGRSAYGTARQEVPSWL